MRSTALTFVTIVALACTTIPAQAEEFPVLFVSPEKDSPVTEIYVLLAGGYVDGLEKGMQGEIFSVSEDSATTVIGIGMLVDVSRFESSSLVKQTGQQPVAAGHKVVLQPVERAKEAYIDEGKRAFDVGDFERAHFFLSVALRGATPEDSAVFAPLVEKSLDSLGAWLDTPPRGKEKEREENKAPACLALAQYYLACGRFAPAQYYFNRLLRVHPDHQVARRIVQAIKELYFSDAKETGHELMATKGHSSDDSSVEVLPEMTRQMEPIYPDFARIQGLEGTVWVKALVTETGRVVRATVGKSSGQFLLDNAAVTAAYGNEFKPGIQDGKAVNCWVSYRVVFELEP